MSYLEVGGRRHSVPVGEMVIGSAPTAHVVLSEPGVLPRHAVVQGMPDGQAAIRLGGEGARVLVNGVRLGPQPTPLLHGDKVEVGGVELLFGDERRSGSTQYVQAIDPATLAGGRPGEQRAPTTVTGGRLVSLTDGREFAVEGSIVIGRDASCEVVLTNRSVSRRHAEVLVSPKGYVLVDSSTNGTFVNGQRVRGQHVLAGEDVIRCGDYEFRFHADVAEVAPPGPELSAMPPPGAVHRLRNTLHGFPAIQRPERPEEGPSEPRAGAGFAGGMPGGVPGEPPPPPSAAPAPVAEAREPGKGPDVMANLVVRSGPLKGQRFPIRVPIVNVGRAEYNDIVLPDDSVSTTHAKLQRREGIWVVVDLDSTNGTLVDGERVSGEAPLAPGAYVRFGEVQTMFEPTDDTIDPGKGSSTRLMGAIKLPPKPPSRGE
jgi:pSer/pThr/pTyr-binding forkhead associated (FHA) protein